MITYDLTNTIIHFISVADKFPLLISFTFGNIRKGSYDAALLSFDWQQDHTAKAEYSVKSSYDTNSAQNHRVDSAQSVHQHVTYYAPLTQHSASRNNSTPHAISYFEMAAQDHEEMNRMKKFNWTKDQLAKAHESSGHCVCMCVFVLYVRT